MRQHNEQSRNKAWGRGGYRMAALIAAFPVTLPILAGFLFLGFTYGAAMSANGFAWWYPMLMALVIFGGSLEFIIANMLRFSFDPIGTLLISLMVQLRHSFYGIGLLKKYQGTGWKKPYLIYGMCDETFSLIYSNNPPEGINKEWFMFFVTLLDQLYWVSGATLGGIFGAVLPFDASGLSFAMTALFIVIFLDQWSKEDNHIPAFVGFGCALVCLVVFGSGAFMAPALCAITLVLLVLRRLLPSPQDKTSAVEGI